MRALRLAVENDTITSELDFETKLTGILSSTHDGDLHTGWEARSVFGYMRAVDDIVSAALEMVDRDQTCLPAVGGFHLPIFTANWINRRHCKMKHRQWFHPISYCSDQRSRR